MPAHRQKRLFDETREAEKVLQFLTNLGPGDISQLVLPTIMQAAHLRYLYLLAATTWTPVWAIEEWEKGPLLNTVLKEIFCLFFGWRFFFSETIFMWHHNFFIIILFLPLPL